METTLKILVIEDNQADFLLVGRHLHHAGLAATCSRVDCMSELKQALDNGTWDLVLSDYSLPKLDFMESIGFLQCHFPNLPVILVSGSVGEEQAIELLKRGVWDFVLKDNLTRLVTAIANSLEKAEETKAKRAAEVAMRESEYRFRSLFSNAPIAIGIGRKDDGMLIEVNAAWLHLFGYERDEVIGKRLAELNLYVDPDERNEIVRVIDEQGQIVNREVQFRHKTGKQLETLYAAELIEFGGELFLQSMTTDITEQKRMESAREATLELLKICNKGDVLPDLMQDLMHYFQKITGCEAVGVRLRDGDDFPYYETIGFSEEFVLVERSLCAYDQKGEIIRDFAGHPTLECMCGDILCSRFDPAKSFFTPHGSFWSSCTSRLLANTTDADRQAKTRNRCIGEGYESVALIPLVYHNETYGLFQFNDRKKGLFTSEKIALLEELVTYVAVALSKLKSDEALRESEQFSTQVINNADEGIVIYGADQRYRGWNPYMELLIGLSAREVMGKYPQELFPFLKDSGMIEQIEKVLSGQRIPVAEFPFYSPYNGYTGWASHITSPLKNAAGEIIGAIGMVRNITARKQAEETLQKLYVAVEQSPSVILITDAEGFVEYANPRFSQITGYSIEEAIGQNPRVLRGDTPNEVYRNLWETIRNGNIWEGEFHNKKKDGTFFWEHAIIAPIRNELGVTTNYLAIKEDITEQRSLQAQLQQSQKMEAIGLLAGGIAHDFNNILTAILGYSTLLQMELKASGKAKEYIENLLVMVEKASHLTKGLLAFSRNQKMTAKLLDLNDVVSTITKLISRVIGENIRVVPHLSKSKLQVMADDGQIEQVLMNLATNARDAMPSGGILTIATDIVTLDHSDPILADSGKPGNYAMISVSDTGGGMDEATISRIFEPFFTTKETGKGTGLGLSILYGIIKQHHGFVSVVSAPGAGTTFVIHIPVTDQTGESVSNTGPTAITGGSETLLVVEDDMAIRSVIVQLLEKFGYRVLVAGDGEEALEIYDGKQKEISLVIMDMIMPRKNGKETYEAMQRIKPDIHALFVSGYPADVISQKNLLPEDVVFLPKPVSPIELLKSIRTILDRQK